MTAMSLHLALAAAAALLALAFAFSTLERWLDRRKPHEAAWTAALFLFAAASLSLWAGAAFGWNGLWFRLFYLFGAIVNVPYLALGTVYLLADRRTAARVATAVHAFAAFSAGVVAVAPLRAPITRATLPQGSDVFGPVPRILAAAGSGVAAFVIVVERGTACTSSIDTPPRLGERPDRRRHRRARRRRHTQFGLERDGRVRRFARRGNHGDLCGLPAHERAAHAANARRRGGLTVSAALGGGACRRGRPATRRRTSPSRDTCSERGALRRTRSGRPLPRIHLA